MKEYIYIHTYIYIYIYIYIYVYIYILQSEPLEHRFQNIEDISSNLKQIHTLFDY